MRLPYVPSNPPMPDAPSAAILSRVLARRKGTLLPLDRALLHSPPVADGWNSFLGAIRTQTTTLSAAVRETAICRVAALNGAWFEWEHHAPLLVNEGGVGEGVVEGCVRDTGRKGLEMVVSEKEEGRAGLSETLGWVVEYTDAMTKGIVVPQRVFEGLRGCFPEEERERGVVELTATVAAYNCVSRFLVALDVGEMAEKYGVDMS